MNYSPLRYPGGKSKLYCLVKSMINKIDNKVVYVEPFVGGGGLALSLLSNGDVDNIIINDLDKGIYSFWRAILTETKKFVELIERTPISIDEWQKQKKIYEIKNNKYSLELGFATFYLNRTNRSGIINAGPIGGFNQTGKYKLNCRFNKNNLIKKILKIAENKNKIQVFNYDATTFINKIAFKFKDRFTYYDPPYYKKGEELYRNYLSHNDHVRIANLIKSDDANWLVTYDVASEIEKLYCSYEIKRYRINYSLANSGAAEELIFSSNDNLWPTEEEIRSLKFNLQLKGKTSDEHRSRSIK